LVVSRRAIRGLLYVTPPVGGGVEWQQGPILNTSDNAIHLMKRLASLRTRIARLKNHLIPDAKNTKRRAQLEKELLEKTADKERIEKELSA